MRLVTSWLKLERAPNGSVRRVPINVRSLTGVVNGQEFESSLERDLLLLVHWDNNVEWYQSQPVRIDYVDAEGIARHYTPDLLVSYRTIEERGQPPKTRKPLLCEVKYREDYLGNWKTLKQKFRAARAYAKEHGYEFRVFTEREIRTDYLKNIQFLWGYRYADFHVHHYEKLREALEEMEEATPSLLLEACYSSKIFRGEALWTLWCMIARGWICCDLGKPLTMQTRIWAPL
jgi:hypothetical protein